MSTLSLEHRAPAPNSVKGSVSAVVHFYDAPKDSRPPEFRVVHPSGAGVKNYGHHKVPVTIGDIRGQKELFTLNCHSFCAIRSPLQSVVDFQDGEVIQNSYYLDIEKLILENVCGAQKVFIFDHCTRKVSHQKSEQRPCGRAARIVRLGTA